MKKQLLLLVGLFLLLIFSCKKDRLDAPRGHPLTQPDTNANWISSGFDTENSCIHQMPDEGINLEQRAISKAIYYLVAGWVPSFNAHGQPIWEGTISTLDSTSGEYTNIVPLIDDEADSVKSIFFVTIRQGTFDYFFFHKKGFLEHRQDSIQLQDNGQAVTLTSNEILALFDQLQYYLYCTYQITERGPNCPNWNDWWKDLNKKLGLWKLNFQNWIDDLFTGPGGDDGPPGDYGGVSGGVFWGEDSTPVSSGQWTSFGGGGGGIFFTDEDIINNYYNTICQWYEGYDPESEFNDIPASILPGGSYDELQAKKCCALSVLQDGGNPMDNPVLADLLSVPGLFDNTIATWVCENGSPLDDNELEMVSVFVVMKNDECGDLAWRDFKQLYEWVVAQPSTSSLNRQEMANVLCLIGMHSDTNIPNEDLLELMLDNNCETDEPYTDNVKCFNDALVPYVINQFLDNENFSQEAQLAASTLQQIQQNSNGELTLAELIDVLNGFELFFDNPSINSEELIDIMLANGVNPLSTSVTVDALVEEMAPIPPSPPGTPMTPQVFWQKAGDIKETLLNKYPNKTQKINSMFPCRVMGPAFEEAGLASLGLPKNEINIGGGVPDAMVDIPMGGGEPPAIRQQPNIIELKCRLGSTFDYSTQTNQLNAYLNYLQSKAFSSNSTILHGLYLIVPNGVSIGQNIIDAANAKNVPLLVSGVSLGNNSVTQFKVNDLEFVNVSSLDRSKQMWYWLPDGVFAWARKRMMKDKLDYTTTLIDFQKHADFFEAKWLIGDSNEGCPQD